MLTQENINILKIALLSGAKIYLEGCNDRFYKVESVCEEDGVVLLENCGRDMFKYLNPEDFVIMGRLFVNDTEEDEQ